MNNDKSIKWQKALMRWDSWMKSTRKMRAKLITDYGEGKPLLTAMLRNSDSRLGYALKAVEKAGGKFVIEEIGINPGSLLYATFFNFWARSATTGIFGKIYTRMIDPNFQVSSKRTRKRGKVEIIDSISWYRGTFSPEEIAKKVLDIKWPSDYQIMKRAKGGRPKNKQLILMEAVVCAILRDKQHLKYREISDEFGWSAPKSTFEVKKQMSQTVFNRVRLGRNI